MRTIHAGGRTLFRRFGLLPCLLCLPLLLGAGCTRTPDTTWFVLDSDIATPPVDKAKGPRLQIRKPDIPAYLDRNAIVTREGGGVRLKLAEFYAWAEPLGAGMQRVLAEVLTPALLEKNVLVQALDDDSGGALQLFVQVQRFDGILGGEATLEARWSLRTDGDVTVARGSFLDKEPSGGSYDTLVQAQSALLRRMGQALAAPLAAAAQK